MKTIIEKLERLIADECDTIGILKAKKRDLDRHIAFHTNAIKSYRNAINRISDIKNK